MNKYDEKRFHEYLNLEKSIFELTVVVIENHIDTPCLYPWFKVQRKVVGYFTSMQEAQKALNDFDATGEDTEDKTLGRGDIFCFYIRELPLDIAGDVDFEPEYRRLTFTAKKKPICDGFSLCMAKKDGNLGLKVYSDVVGHRFKVGDIVFLLKGDEVMIAIVSKSAFTEDNNKRDNWDEKNYKSIWHWDYDGCMAYEPCYAVLFGSGVDFHDHPSGIDLFPSPIKVPVLIEKLLKRDLELALEAEKEEGKENQNNKL